MYYRRHEVKIFKSKIWDGWCYHINKDFLSIENLHAGSDRDVASNAAKELVDKLSEV